MVSPQVTLRVPLLIAQPGAGSTNPAIVFGDERMMEGVGSIAWTIRCAKTRSARCRVNVDYVRVSTIMRRRSLKTISRESGAAR